MNVVIITKVVSEEIKIINHKDEAIWGINIINCNQKLGNNGDKRKSA